VNGGQIGAGGGHDPLWRRPAVITTLVFIGFGLVSMVVNVTSLVDERRSLGLAVEPWRPWVWESTSLIAWLLMLPLILTIAARAPSGRPVRAIGVHLSGMILSSLGHGAIMWVLRKLAYAAAGQSYRLTGPMLDVLVYEFRKDLITYLAVVLCFVVASRIVAQPPPGAGGAREGALIEVRDGTRTSWMKPEEIDWVAAAGNYVELNGAFGTRLARRTLADMERELVAHGFVRLHRSRLVRKAAIARIETRQSGDFDIMLRSGEIVGGSRRFRDKLQAPVS